MSFKPKDITVWMEIPSTDLNRSIAFYNKVLDVDLKIDNTGPNPMATFEPADPGTGIAGHIYPGKPAPKGTGNTIHLATPGQLEDTVKRVRDAGGEVVSDIIAIPAGRFFYAHDPDGNSIGLFQYT